MALKQIAGALTGSATEDNQLTAYGTVFVSGAAAPGAFLTGTFLGRYGTLTLQASGEWQYVLANTDTAVQSLAAGATVHELFGVSWTDGSDVTAGVIDIAVNGTNDVAVFSGDAERTLDVTAATGVSGQMFAQDNDAGEKGFQASTMTGSVGTLTID
jgi:VCBS repeat-containing protein